MRRIYSEYSFPNVVFGTLSKFEKIHPRSYIIVIFFFGLCNLLNKFSPSNLIFRVYTFYCKQICSNYQIFLHVQLKRRAICS